MTAPSPSPPARFDLDRFVEAQQDTYDRALAELRDGRKRSHWMWFIFPQVRGLGLSAMAARYAIASLDEARAYLAHPILGPRLRECVAALAAVPGNEPVAVLGGVDALKLRSSLTLFGLASGHDPLFENCLQKFYDGEPDQATLALVARGAAAESRNHPR